MDSPSVDDFFKKISKAAPLTSFILALEEGVPTMLPRKASLAMTIQNRRAGVKRAASRHNIPIRTIIREGEVWVLRLERHNERAEHHDPTGRTRQRVGQSVPATERSTTGSERTV
jgi:hypothetical protein